MKSDVAWLFRCVKILMLNFEKKLPSYFVERCFKFKNMIWTMTFSMERWKERKRTHGDIS